MRSNLPSEKVFPLVAWGAFLLCMGLLPRPCLAAPGAEGRGNSTRIRVVLAPMSGAEEAQRLLAGRLMGALKVALEDVPELQGVPLQAPLVRTPPVRDASRDASMETAETALSSRTAPRVLLSVKGPPGTPVLLDGRPLCELPCERRVSTGTHLLEAPDGVGGRLSRFVKVGGARTTLSLQALGAQVPPDVAFVTALPSTLNGEELRRLAAIARSRDARYILVGRLSPIPSPRRDGEASVAHFALVSAEDASAALLPPVRVEARVESLAGSAAQLASALAQQAKHFGSPAPLPLLLGNIPAPGARAPVPPKPVSANVPWLPSDSPFRPPASPPAAPLALPSEEEPAPTRAPSLSPAPSTSPPPVVPLQGPRAAQASQDVVHLRKAPGVPWWVWAVAAGAAAVGTGTYFTITSLQRAHTATVTATW